MNVLLVEDNVGDVELVELALGQVCDGVSLHVATDGVQALAQLRGTDQQAALRPDFVLLDLKLPRKNGLEVLTELKRDPELRRIPVVVLTSSDAEIDICSAYDLHAAGYFTKPAASFNIVLESIVSFMRSAALPTQAPRLRAQVVHEDPAPSSVSSAFTEAAIIESAGDAIVAIGLEGTIQSWNSAAERLFGYTVGEAIGKNARLLVPDEQLGELTAAFDAARRGQTASMELERFDAGGSYRALSLLVSPIRDRRGTIVGASGIARDVTVQKQEAEKYRLATDAAPNAFLMVNERGEIVMLNQQAERMFGYDRQELLGQPIGVLVPERVRAAHAEHRARYQREPEMRAMGAGRELYARRKDGSEFPVEIGLNPIQTSTGALVLSAVVDITERKLAEERFRQAVESSPSAMVMTNAQGRIVLVNRETERMFGYARDELAGRSVEALVPVRFRGQHPHYRKTFLSQPHSREMGAGRDLYGLRKDGSEFPVEIGLNPLQTDEGVLVLSAILDITSRKRAEQALAQKTQELERSNAELEQFAYVASHDLQEPLRMVTSFTQLLAKNYAAELDERAQNYIRFAADGALRMQALIRDLLAYSRVSSRGGEVVAVDANVALDHALKNLRASIDESGAEVISEPLPVVLANSTQLAELFQNLIGNAVKFASATTPSVRVSSSRSGGFHQITVSDNGIGIDMQYAGRIFQVFERLHTREEYAGTGIGLAICKRIVERAGGRIWVEPNSGGGSAFSFTLPAGEMEQ